MVGADQPRIGKQAVHEGQLDNPRLQHHDQSFQNVHTFLDHVPIGKLGLRDQTKLKSNGQCDLPWDTHQQLDVRCAQLPFLSQKC